MLNDIALSPIGRGRRRQFLAIGAGLGLNWAGFAAASASVPAVRVLAASDLKFVLTRLVARYQQETGQAVALTFGSSGNMTRQIQQGLPADVFMSADEDYVLQLARVGLTQGDGVLYAQGRIALYLAPGSPIPPDPGLQGLRTHWSAVQKFAIANPEHAPYGRAARQALQALQLWETVQPRLVLGENIAQTTQFVSTGAAQAGITALSLVVAPELRGQGQFVALPSELHAPLRQRMVLLRKASAAANLFYQYLQLAPARAVMAQYGFVAPP